MGRKEDFKESFIKKRGISAQMFKKKKKMNNEGRFLRSNKTLVKQN